MFPDKLVHDYESVKENMRFLIKRMKHKLTDLARAFSAREWKSSDPRYKADHICWSCFNF